MPQLFDGQHITCPRCRAEHHVLDVEVRPEMPVFASQTVPILRCPECHWEFALRQASDELRQVIK